MSNHEEPTVPLASYAAVMAGLGAGLPLSRALLHAGVEPSAWEQAAEHWQARIDESAASDLGLLVAFDAALLDARRRFDPSVEPIASDAAAWACFRRHFVTAVDPVAFLAGRGLTLATYARLEADWANRVLTDEALAAAVQAHMQGPLQACPAITLTPSPLLAEALAAPPRSPVPPPPARAASPPPPPPAEAQRVPGIPRGPLPTVVLTDDESGPPTAPSREVPPPPPLTATVMGVLSPFAAVLPFQTPPPAVRAAPADEIDDGLEPDTLEPMRSPLAPALPFHAAPAASPVGAALPLVAAPPGLTDESGDTLAPARSPFAPALPFQGALPKAPDDDTIEPDTLEPVRSPFAAVLHFQAAAPAAPVGAHPRLKLDQLASLSAELSVHTSAAAADEVRKRWGLTEPEHRAELQAWTERFGKDQALYVQFTQLYERYRAWHRNARRT